MNVFPLSGVDHVDDCPGYLRTSFGYSHVDHVDDGPGYLGMSFR